MEVNFCTMREKLQDISVVLFDLDGTLIDTKGADREACYQVSRYLEIQGIKKNLAREITDKFYDYIRARPQDPVKNRWDVDTWRTMIWAEALGPKHKRYASNCYSIWKEDRLEYMSLTDEVQNMLVELRNRYKLGLITNGPSKAQWEKINRIEGQKYFDIIVVSDDWDVEKPDPAIFEIAFRNLDVSAKECMMVGDKLSTDVLGGIRVGIGATVWCSTKDPWDTPEPKPDFVVSDVSEVMELLPKVRRKSLRSSRANLPFPLSTDSAKFGSSSPLLGWRS